LTIAGGSGNFLYSWTGPNGFTASTKDISGLYAGQYTCTVTDLNGCILTPSPSFTLTEPDALAVSSTSSTSNDGAYNINCNGGTGSVIINVTGGSVGNYTYTWSTADGSGIVQGQKDQLALTTGTYHLDVKDLNNCEISTDITLTQPPALVTSMATTNITCQASNLDNGSIDLTVTGGVGTYVYLWSNGETTQDISGLTQGTYYVTVTNNGVCNSYDSATISLPPPLEYTKTLSDYNGYNISCNGLANGSIQVEPTSGLAPFTYSWTGPDGFVATSKNISNLKAGDYHLLITDSNFCTETETINLTEPGVLDISFTLSSSIAGGYNINCSGESTGTISVEPVNQVKTVDYLWADGVFGKTRNNLPAGDYHVIIIDANNCQASSSVTLTEPDSIKLNFDITQPLCPDMPDGEIRLTVTGGVIGTDYYYHWSDNSSGRNISNILKGLYKVTVEDLNGCSVTDSVNIEPLHETCLVIPNAISPNDDLINDVWNIGMTDLYPEMEVKIFNRWGELIWKSEKGYPSPWNGTSHGARLPIDSYHYIIDLHNGEKPLIGTITRVK
jgi:gliding motility-associated-like protein